MLERLHTYVLLAPLSEDAVHEAREATFQDEDGSERRVWLDIVSLAGATDEMRERFTEDAEAATRVRNEALVPLIDHGMDAGFAYAVYEAQESLSLAALIETSPDGHLEPELVALIGADVAAGLAYAHGRRPALVHGALSPSVIHAYADGQTRLRGWAAPALWRSIAVAAGSVGDATAYLSPEIVQGRPITQRTDLFSLGSTLYEALLGRRAFDAPTPLATGIKIRIGTYETLDKASPDTPAPLRQMVSKMLSADASKRPNPLSLRNALSTVVRDEKALRTQLRDRFAPPPVERPPSTGLVAPLDREAELFDYQPSPAASFDDSTSLDASLGSPNTDSEIRVPEFGLDSVSERLDADAAPMFATAEPTMAHSTLAQSGIAEATVDLASMGPPAISQATFADSGFGAPDLGGQAPFEVTEEHELTADQAAPESAALPKTEVIRLPPEMDYGRTDQMPQPSLPPGVADPFGAPPPAPLSPTPPLEPTPPSSGPSRDDEWPVAKLAALAALAIGLVLITALFAAMFAG